MDDDTGIKKPWKKQRKYLDHHHQEDGQQGLAK
jgi:hypothetical protein